MISRHSHRGSASEPSERPHANPSGPLDLTAAELADLRALWCEAEIVRHLLTVAVGQVDFDETLASLNVLLRPYAGVEITDLVVVDIDAAAALGVDVPSADDEITIDTYRGALSRGETAPLAVNGEGSLLVAGVCNGLVNSLARIHPTTERVVDDIVTGVRDGLGEAVHRAAAIERARR